MKKYSADNLISLLSEYSKLNNYKIECIYEKIPFILSSVDTNEKIEQTEILFNLLTDENLERAMFCLWASSIAKSENAVYSRILYLTHARGKTSSLLTCFTLTQRIEMFEQALPQYLMNKNEYEHFLKLPETIKIYRGGKNVSNNKLKYGMSWTTNLNKAKWFSERFIGKNDTAIVIEADVKKCNIFGVFEYENEVIIKGGRVSNLKKVNFI